MGLSKTFVTVLSLLNRTQRSFRMAGFPDFLSFRLRKTVGGRLQVCLLAPRAAAWPGETFSLFKHIPAGHAAKREHRELPFLCQCRQRDVRKMLVDFPFPYADGLGDLPGGHLFVIQEEDYLLTDRLRRGFLFHGHSLQSQSHRQKGFRHLFTTSRPPVAIFSQFGFTGNSGCGRKSLLMSIQRGRQGSQKILCHSRDLILHM